MVEVRRSTVIDAPLDAVWTVLRDFNGHDRWHPAVAESVIEEGRRSDEVGCVRRFRMVDGGVLRQPTLLRRDPADLPAGQQVISGRTSQQIRGLMRLVVDAGTGKMANVPGYMVGGKTGTAEKQEGRGYARSALLASFVGAFPMADPRYVILVMVDEPKPNAKSHGYATGGWVAAPAVARIVQRMAPLIGMPPLDESNKAAENELLVDINATELVHAAE